MVPPRPNERYGAELMDGRSAVLRPIVVTPDIGAVRLTDAATGAPVGLWTFGGLKAHALAEGILHLEHRDAPGVLVTSADRQLPRALAVAGVRIDGLPQRGRRARFVAIYAAAIATLVTGIYLSLPAVSAAIARQIPFEVEEKLALRLDGVFANRICRTDASTQAIETLRRRLEGASGPDGARRREIGIINLDMVNAFTFPGGRVFLTRGLLAEAKNSEEVAGVLAHELAHVSERHIMTQLVRSSILSLGWAVTVGDFSGLFLVDPSTVLDVATLRFSRDAERDADRGALGRLDRARISREGLAGFFERMAKEHGDVPAWLSTHPASKERRAAILDGAPRAGITPALSPEAFAALKAACGTKK